MSQNKCFPTLKCISRSKSTTDSLKPSLRMPTLREFLHKPTNAGTQTSICQTLIKTEEIPSFSSKQSTTPTNHRSTIVIRNANAFVPLSNSDHTKPANKITNNSFLSQIGKVPNRDSTLFMSKGSFDEIFEELRMKNMQKLEDSKKDGSRSSRVGDPFVMTELKPRIVPITPLYRKRSFNCRPLAKGAEGALS